MFACQHLRSVVFLLHPAPTCRSYTALHNTTPQEQLLNLAWLLPCLARLNWCVSRQQYRNCNARPDCQRDQTANEFRRYIAIHNSGVACHYIPFRRGPQRGYGHGHGIAMTDDGVHLRERPCPSSPRRDRPSLSPAHCWADWWKLETDHANMILACGAPAMTKATSEHFQKFQPLGLINLPARRLGNAVGNSGCTLVAWTATWHMVSLDSLIEDLGFPILTLYLSSARAEKHLKTIRM